MPELPEVETIRRGLKHLILGKTIARVEVRLPKVVSIGLRSVSINRKSSRKTARQFEKILSGKEIVAIKRRAKILLLKLEEFWVMIHLKMTGQLIYAKKGERKKVKLMNFENSKVLELPHKHTHVIFRFTDGSRLFFNDLRQFGYARLIRHQDIDSVKELMELGPEPLTNNFSLRNLLIASKRHPKLAIKQLLMDPKVVAGIGNIYSDEILFRARVKPQRKVAGIEKWELRRIYKNIKKILNLALKAQGSSVGDFFKVDGTEGRFRSQHQVYARAGERCKRCQGVIKSVKLGGRTSSYCPKCQR